MLVTGLVYVSRYALTNPFVDEWHFMPVLIGDEPSIPWLWQLHNEHRFPLPRAIYLSLFHLTGDLRVGCYVSLLAISLLAMGLMRLARKVRGRASLSDAVFPLLLMHVGQDENLYMGYQLCFMLVTVLACALIAAMLSAVSSPHPALSPQSRGEGKTWSLALAALLLGLLLLTCGAAGLVYGVAAAAWAIYLAIRGPMRPYQRFTIAALAAITPAYIVLYTQGYVRPSHHPESAGFYESMRIAMQAQSMAFGPSASGLWPAIGVGILIAGIWVMGLLVWRIVRDRDSTAIGLLLLVLAGGAVVFGIGWGRSGFHNDMGLAWRYGWIAFPAIAAAYFTWLRCGGRVCKYAPDLLCLFVVIVTPVNTISGFMHAENKLRPREQAWEADVRSGLTAEQVIAKHYPNYPLAFREEMADILRLMRDQRYTYYESLGRESP